MGTVLTNLHNMNWLLLLIIPAIPCLLFPVVTFARKKKLLKAQVMGNLTMIFLAFALMMLAVFVTDANTHSLSVHIFYTILAVFVAPMVFLTVCSGTQVDGPTVRQRREAAILPVLYLIGYVIILNILGTDRFQVYVNQLFEGVNHDLELPGIYSWMRAWDFYAFRGLLALQTVVFLVMMVRLLHRYRKEVEQINVQYGRKVKLMGLHMGAAAAATVAAILTIASHSYNQIYYDPTAMIVFIVLMTYVTVMIGILNVRMEFSAETVHKPINN